LAALSWHFVENPALKLKPLRGSFSRTTWHKYFIWRLRLTVGNVKWIFLVTYL
jgi:peptidoglycan/LPS O-acetylase OafA/YrhL